MQPEEKSVTQMISLLKVGDREAAGQLWGRYFRKLVELARVRLRSMPRRAIDEEDVAVSVFDSFFRRAEQGQFPQLDDRDDLWQLLFVLTVRKAANLCITRTANAGEVAGFPPSQNLSVWEPTKSSALSPRPSWRRNLPRSARG